MKKFQKEYGKLDPTIPRKPLQVSIENPDDIRHNEGTLPVIKLRDSPSPKKVKHDQSNFNTIEGRTKSLMRPNRKGYGLHTGGVHSEFGVYSVRSGRS